MRTEHELKNIAVNIGMSKKQNFENFKSTQFPAACTGSSKVFEQVINTNYVGLTCHAKAKTADMEILPSENIGFISYLLFLRHFVLNVNLLHIRLLAVSTHHTGTIFAAF